MAGQWNENLSIISSDPLYPYIKPHYATLVADYSTRKPKIQEYEVGLLQALEKLGLTFIIGTQSATYQGKHALTPPPPSPRYWAARASNTVIMMDKYYRTSPSQITCTQYPPSKFIIHNLVGGGLLFHVEGFSVVGFPSSNEL